MDGILKAKQKGVRFGASKKLIAGQIEELKKKCAAGVLIKTLINDYRLSKASVYRYLETNADSDSDAY